MTATVVSGSQEGWVVGDRVQITPNAHNYENETDGGVTIQFTSTTQFRLIIGDVIVALNKTTGRRFFLDNTVWSLQITFLHI